MSGRRTPASARDLEASAMDLATMNAEPALNSEGAGRACPPTAVHRKLGAAGILNPGDVRMLDEILANRFHCLAGSRHEHDHRISGKASAKMKQFARLNGPTRQTLCTQMVIEQHGRIQRSAHASNYDSIGVAQYRRRVFQCGLPCARLIRKHSGKGFGLVADVPQHTMLSAHAFRHRSMGFFAPAGRNGSGILRPCPADA